MAITVPTSFHSSNGNDIFIYGRSPISPFFDFAAFCEISSLSEMAVLPFLCTALTTSPTAITIIDFSGYTALSDRCPQSLIVKVWTVPHRRPVGNGTIIDGGAVSADLCSSVR
jgi:hypothetical protein